MTDRRVPLDEPDELSPPDEEEQRSAAALARALDGGRAEPGLPEDALAAAALLRLSAGTARLSEERGREIRAELLGSLPPRAQRPSRPRWLSWLLPLLPLASAAAAYLLFFANERGGDTLASRADRALASAEAPSSVTSAEAPPAARAAASPGAPSAKALPVPASPEDLSGAASTEALSDALGAVGSGAAAARRPTLAAAQPAATRVERPSALAKRERAFAEPEPAGAERDRAPTPPASDGARRALTEGLERDARELRRALLARTDDAALKRAHADLDAARAKPELRRAQRTLAELSQSLADSPDDADGRAIRQDLYCRLAETALRLGEPQAALEWTRRGLALDGSPTPFLAQLEALQGDAWAALGDDERAARGYMKALEVHEKLLDEDLDGR